MKYILTSIILLILCGQFLSCAKVILPSGGEGDKTQPTILSISPDNKSLNINPKTKIQIKFSEWINPKTIENAIFISPQTEFSIKINAKTAEIKPKSPLKENTSYHISLLGDIMDFSANPLSASKNIIFSTGNFIDSAFLEGRIFFEKTDSLFPKVALFFDERAAQNDTVLLSMPDYITQADSAGFFRFDNIMPAKYRVIGLLDKNRDNKITPTETVFIGKEKVVETQNFYELFPATSDTTQNKIASVNVFSPIILSVRIKFATEDKPFENIRITNPQSKETIRLEKIQRLDDKQTIAVFLKDSLQNKQYSLETKAKRIIEYTDSLFFYDKILFNGTTLTDTINLTKFNDLLNPKALTAPVKSDSTDIDSIKTASTNTVPVAAICPRISWNYHGKLPENPLWELRSEKKTSVFTTENFVENIPAGTYTLLLIDDGNQNQKFDTGTLFPFAAGEKKIVFPDIITARELWEVEYEIADYEIAEEAREVEKENDDEDITKDSL